MAERLPRNEFLETGGNFTIEELEKVGLGPEEVVKSMKGRVLLFVGETASVRAIPLKLLEAVKKAYEDRKNPKELFSILRCGYEIYRSSVNRSLYAPMVLVNNVLEWPEPANFGWDNLEGVVALGFAMGALGKEDGVKVITFEGKRMKSLDVISGQIDEREFGQLIANPQGFLKFKVPKLADVRVVNSQAWQNWANTAFANGLSQAIEDMGKGLADKNKVDEFATFFFEDAMNKSRKVPVVRYAKEGETSSPQNLLTFNF